MKPAMRNEFRQYEHIQSQDVYIGKALHFYLSNNNQY